MLLNRLPQLPAIILASGMVIALAACSSSGSRTPSSKAGAGTPSSRPASTKGMKSSGSGGMNMSSAPDCPAVPKPASAPKRVVTMDAGDAAILIRLGLGDRIVGTASPDFASPFTGSMAAKVKAVKVIDPGRGNKEAVLAAKPDLVTGISVYELGSFDGTPTTALLKQNGIDAYVSCPPADPVQSSLDETYTYVQNLADIFHVPAKGRALVTSMKKQVAAAEASTANVAVLAISTAPDGGQGVNTSGGASMVNAVITLAGGRNIAQSVPSRFATLSAEVVATANPKVIIAITGLTRQSPAQLKSAIEASPLLAGTDAVKDKRIVMVPGTIALSPSLLNAQAVATIAAAITAAAITAAQK